jgi:hypothetical protein
MLRFQALRTIPACSAPCKGTTFRLLLSYDILHQGNLENFHVRLGRSAVIFDSYEFVPTAFAISSPKPSSLSLQRPTLDKCEITKKDLGNLLAACSRLKALTYSVDSRTVGFTTVSPSELPTVLGSPKNVLEELYVNFGYLDHELYSCRRLTSLATFTALRVLHTNPEMWDCLTSVADEDKITLEPFEDEEGIHLAPRLPRRVKDLVSLRGNTPLRDGYKLQMSNLLDTRHQYLPELQALHIVRPREDDDVIEYDTLWEKIGNDLDFRVLEDNPPRTGLEGELGQGLKCRCFWTGTKHESYRSSIPKSVESALSRYWKKWDVEPLS